MTPDQAIQRVEDFRRYFPGAAQPSATVILSASFLDVVEHMASKMPPTPALAWPEEEDVRWAWREGVNFVFERTVVTENMIVSKDGPYGSRVPLAPHIEVESMEGIVYGPQRLTPTMVLDSQQRNVSMMAQPTTTMPTDVAIGASSGFTVFGQKVHARGGHQVAGLMAWQYSLVTLLGLGVARVSSPAGIGRAGYRRIERSGQTVRVIDLDSPSGGSDGEPVDWQHSWWVRGHWRNQVCGPHGTLRKLIWIDQHVKGFGPLDERPTVWTK